MEVYLTTLLRQEVEKIFGRKVLSSADCRYLCSEIEQWGNAKVSFNTLRRFFNLMKADHQPSLYTLNTLSVYCGFPSFDAFVTSKRNSSDATNKEGAGLLNYLILLFKNMEVCTVNDATYFSLVHHTIGFLEQHTYLIDRFQKEIAATKNGQKFYYELFIQIDKLNSFYGAGLNYYLHERKDNEAQIFAHSLLCFKSWLTGDMEGLDLHYSVVSNSLTSKYMPPSTYARYFASHIFYADMCKLEKDPLLIKAKQFYINLLPHKEHYATFYCFEIILAEALILTSRFEEALFYLDELFVKLKRYVPSYIDVALLETVCLFKAIVFAHTGKKQKAFEILGDISPYKFCFLSKQYLTLLYLELKSTFRDRYTEQEQIAHLIQQTGFSRLSSVWQNDRMCQVKEKV